MVSEDTKSCVLCAKEYTTRDSLHLHLLRHLSYRRYACSSCNTSFYTEEEREDHCKETSHINMFEMKVNQYNEMLVKQLMKDIEVSSKFDIDFVIRERARAGLFYEKSIDEGSPVQKKRTHDRTTSPSVNRSQNTSRKDVKDPENCRCSPAPADPSSENIQTPSKKKKVPPPQKKRKPSSTSESNTTADDIPLTSIETMNISGLMDQCLTTQVQNIKCKLCKRKISSVYETRKNHVSLHHMPCNHNDLDYVDILEHKMQEAFPGIPYSDYQCQFPNCFKFYKSQSSRRAHVLGCHFTAQIECPMEECGAVYTDAYKAHTHLKVDHKLLEGAKSIKDTVLKYKFEYEKRAHNSKLEKTVRLAFPCPLPTPPKMPEKDATKDGLIIRDGADRSFQKFPPLPRRARTSSSSESEASPNKSPLSTSTPKRSSNTDKSEKLIVVRERKNSESSCHSESTTPIISINEESQRKKSKKRTQNEEESLPKEKSTKRIKSESFSTELAEISSQVGSLSSDIKEFIDDPCLDDSSKTVPKEEENAKSEKVNTEVRYELIKRKPLLVTPPLSEKLHLTKLTLRHIPKYTRMSASIVRHFRNQAND